MNRQLTVQESLRRLATAIAGTRCVIHDEKVAGAAGVVHDSTDGGEVEMGEVADSADTRLGTAQNSAWLVGIREPVDEVMSLARYPVGHDMPSLDYRHIAADIRHPSLRTLEGATVLYVPPGVISWNLGPRLPLAARAVRIFEHSPDAQIVAAALDERRCWAQLRGTGPVILTVATSGIDPLLLASLLYVHRVPARGGWGPYGLDLGEVETVRVDDHIVTVRVSTPDPAEDWPLDTLAPRAAAPRRGRDVARVAWVDAERRARELFLPAVNRWSVLRMQSSGRECCVR
jgi:hypothetical protein